jgi:hypothetical protein
MLYVVDTPKDVATAARDLEEAVKRNKFGMIRPTALLALFPGAADLKTVAEDVERETMWMIDEAR